MIQALSRILAAVFILPLVMAGPLHADPMSIAFKARIGTGNSIDIQDVFGEGFGADLAGQVIVGTISIAPGPLQELCDGGPACYGDIGAGAITVSFALNNITASVVSAGTLGYFGGRSGGSVSIGDRSHGGYNYLAAGATSADGMVQESIGVLFGGATPFLAYGGGDPAAAIASLGSIGSGAGLVSGGITFMSPVEHLDATIFAIDVPEPAVAGIFAATLVLLGTRRRPRESLKGTD